MYQEASEDKEWEDSINEYAFSIDAANELLDQTEWKYESDGTTAWDSSKATATNEYYRYNADKEVLTIKHFGTENNNVTTSLRDKFVLNMPLCRYEIRNYHWHVRYFTLNHYYFGFQLKPTEPIACSTLPPILVQIMIPIIVGIVIGSILGTMARAEQ